MENLFWINENFYDLIIIPLLIFFARILDVTIGTLRIIFVAKGNRVISPILGFFEVLIWIIAVSRIFEHLDNFLYYIAFAGGFAVGNYVGLLVEEKLAIGIVIIRVFTKSEPTKLLSVLYSKGYGVTTVLAHGVKENTNIIYTIVKRQEIKKVANLIEEHHPNAFYVVEDIRHVSHSVFPMKSIPQSKVPVNVFRRWQKGK